MKVHLNSGRRLMSKPPIPLTACALWLSERLKLTAKPERVTCLNCRRSREYQQIARHTASAEPTSEGDGIGGDDD